MCACVRRCGFSRFCSAAASISFGMNDAMPSISSSFLFSPFVCCAHRSIDVFSLVCFAHVRAATRCARARQNDGIERDKCKRRHKTWPNGTFVPIQQTFMGVYAVLVSFHRSQCKLCLRLFCSSLSFDTKCSLNAVCVIVVKKKRIFFCTFSHCLRE